MNERRLACTCLPDFPLELYGKLRPGLLGHPVALVTEKSETAVITDCNSHAAKSDITIGMTVAQANSLCPGLIIGVRDREREQAVLRLIRHALKTVGPEIESDSDAIVFLESSRLMKLYGDESGIARKILAVLRPFGYPVTIGFAVNKFVALTAARHASFNQWVIVPSGSEGSWLQQLQVGQLALTHDTAETLFDLGIATVGQAAALPANEVVQRFGTEGAVFARRARGDDTDQFVPERPAEDLCETTALDFPVRSTDTILTCIETILDRLLAQLRRTGCSARELQVQLHLDNRTERAFKIAVEKPSAAPARFLRQVRLTLESLQLEAAAREITIRIPCTATLLLEQTAFVQPGERETIDPEATATINRTLSGNSLCTALLFPSHLPERTFRLSPVTPSPAKRSPASLPSILSSESSRIANLPPYSLGRIAGLRLLQPPRPTNVNPAEGWLRDDSGVHRVTERRGPWKLSGDWWGAGFDRLYYELRTTEQREYLVFFDQGKSQWFLQGVYD